MAFIPMKSFILRSALMFLFLPVCLYAQNSGKKSGKWIVKQTANFDLSGKGNAPEWQATDWVPLAKRKGEADYATKAKLLYSDTGIYGLFSCQDKKITATLKEDFASLWTEDVVEIFFWTDESVPLYFEYELSPLDFELAILVPNNNGNFFGWRPWQYEGARKTRHATSILRDKEGNVTEWQAEFFIPYALLKPLGQVPPKKGMQWRVNLYRIDYDQENTSWSWQPVEKTFHDYKKFGVMQFD